MLHFWPLTCLTHNVYNLGSIKLFFIKSETWLFMQVQVLYLCVIPTIPTRKTRIEAAIIYMCNLIYYHSVLCLHLTKYKQLFHKHVVIDTVVITIKVTIYYNLAYVL